MIYFSRSDAKSFAQSLKVAKDEYGLDGVDFDVEDGAVKADIQAEVIKAVRIACGKDFHIRYGRKIFVRDESQICERL